MSTERDEIEKQLAGELGFSVVNPKVAGIGHVPEFVEGDGESDTDYIADGRHWALFDALVDARLKLAEVERERDRLEGAIRWAMGEKDEFSTRREGQGAYWWREELRVRSALLGYSRTTQEAYGETKIHDLAGTAEADAEW